MDENKRKALDTALGKLDKQFGKGTVMRMGDKTEMKVETIPTGSMNLDLALGVGGLPKGRIVEIYGPESCIRGNAYIQYELRSKDGKKINHKGGTLERLYERFHNICEDGRANKINYEDVEFYVAAINEKNCVVQQKIVDVVNKGEKYCYTLTTWGGKSVDATEDHKFYIGNGEYKRLDELSIGDSVYVHDNVRNRKEIERKLYPEIMVKYHPSNRTKIVNGFLYYRLRESHLVYEAHLNNFTPEEYRNVLNTKDKIFIDSLNIIDVEKYDIHHKDGNPENNVIDNLEMIEKSKHYREHALLNQEYMSFIVVEDEIKSIEPCGAYTVYDIKCDEPYHNFIANGIVVHNCGKSTLAMHCVREVQKEGGVACYIDAEHAMDPVYAAQIGVNVDDLYITQPSSGEQALEIAETMVRSGAIDLVVVDSVAALTPQAEIDGEMGDAQVGLQARLMSKGLRKLTAAINTSKCIVIFINQLREKVGIMFGSNETTTGGRALKFYSSIRLDMRRIETLKQAGIPIGNHVRVKVVKNKVAPPFREAEFDIIFGKGISRETEIIDIAVNLNIIEKSGAWFTYINTETGRKERWQGKERVKEGLAADTALRDEVEKRVMASLYPNGVGATTVVDDDEDDFPKDDE